MVCKKVDAKISRSFCNEDIGDEFGSCSCQDCAQSCPPLPEYPEPVPRDTVGNIDMWGFVALMIAILLVIVFVVVVVLRKHFKARNRTEDVTAVTGQEVQKQIYKSTFCKNFV